MQRFEMLTVRLAVGAAVAVGASAKSPRGFMLTPESYEFASAQFSGTGETESAASPLEPVFVTTVQTEDTPWLRVQFGNCALGANSYLMLTSTRDGQSQRLDAAALAEWQNTSAIFNGQEVQIELFAAGEDEGVFFEISNLLVADPEDLAIGFSPEPAPIIESSLCDSNDERAPSTDPRVGRLFMGGCTGWLVHNGAALTAGHCGNGAINGVLEFNVPASMSNGTPVAAPANDQFPITGVTSFRNNGEGEDYAVFSVGLSNGQRAHLRQGFFHMTSLAPSEGTTVRVTGFGLDASPPGVGGAGAPCCDWDADGDCDFNCNTANVAQQTDTGACDDCLVGTAIEHEVDTTPANSGSPILINSSDAAIGVHSHGGCDDFFSDFDNAGTWLGFGPLSSALQSFLPNHTWVDAISQQTARNGTVLAAFRTLPEAIPFTPAGGTIALVAGNYPAASGNAVTITSAMTLTAPVGTVVIGN